MQSPFNPYDPAELRKQADLYRRMAAAMGKPHLRAKLKAVAAQYEEQASEAATPVPPATL
jgi:hypothetical protein